MTLIRTGKSQLWSDIQVQVSFDGGNWLESVDEDYYVNLFQRISVAALAEEVLRGNSRISKVISEAFGEEVSRGEDDSGEGCLLVISVLLCDGSCIRNLNKDFRNKDQETNCLSFPMLEAVGGDMLLGDIAMCYNVIMDESELMKNTGVVGSPAGESDNLGNFELHLSHLFVHSVLHLLDYDHRTEVERVEMEDLENKALKMVGIQIL